MTNEARVPSSARAARAHPLDPTRPTSTHSVCLLGSAQACFRHCPSAICGPRRVTSPGPMQSAGSSFILRLFQHCSCFISDMDDTNLPDMLFQMISTNVSQTGCSIRVVISTIRIRSELLRHLVSESTTTGSDSRRRWPAHHQIMTRDS